MISGAHVILYSADADADRAFFRDVLDLQAVDAGGGWLIFALPPAEAAFHPAETGGGHELFLMCDNLAAEMAALSRKGVACEGVQELRWGSLTHLVLPGGGRLGLYQPKHPTALAVAKPRRKPAAKPAAASRSKRSVSARRPARRAAPAASATRRRR